MTIFRLGESVRDTQPEFCDRLTAQWADQCMAFFLPGIGIAKPTHSYLHDSSPRRLNTVDGATGTLTNFARGVTNEGYYVHMPAVSGWTSNVANLSNTIGTGPFSIACRFRVTVQSGFDSVWMYDRFSSGVGIYSQVSSGANWGIWCANSSLAAGTNINTNQWYSCVAVRRNTGAGGIEFYLDSLPDGTATSSGNVTGATNDRLYFNDNGAGGRAPSHDILYGGVWSRPLSVDEIQSLHENPWSAFVDEDQLTAFVTAAPVGGLPPGMLNRRGAVGGIQLDGGMLA